jgi:phage I-like protein
MNTLPETIAPGESLEIQIAPHGGFPGILCGPKSEDRRRIVQHCTASALANVANAFKPEVLVDRDHEAEDGGSTEAMAWVTALRHDPATGLMATIKFTDIGADAVSNRRYRFVSPVFDISQGPGDVVTPIALAGLAFTNRPNLPVQCVLNRADGANPSEPVEQRKPNMDKIKEMLGLPPEADEAAIAEAIAALKSAVEAAKTAALIAEAETVANANQAKICNSEGFVKLYVANRDYALQLLEVVKALEPAAPARVTNAADARTPQHIAADRGDVLAVYNSLQGAEKLRYLREHSLEIDAARRAAE